MYEDFENREYLEDKEYICARDISNSLEGTGKHINVLLSLALNKSRIIRHLSHFQEDKKFYIWADREYFYNDYIPGDIRYVEDIHIFLEKEAFRLGKNDILILMDKNARDRKALGEYLDKYQSKRNKLNVITFNTPALSEETARELHSLGIITNNVNVKERVRATNNRAAMALTFEAKQYHIYKMKTIFDIRDIGLAQDSEQTFIKRQLKQDIKANEEQFKSLYLQLQNKECDLAEIAKQERNCILLLELIQFLQEIIASAGIDNNAVIEQFLAMQRIKAENEADLLSAEAGVRKEARKKIVDAIAESVNRLTRSTITVAVYDEIEAEIIDTLSKNVWNKLTSDSKRYLVSSIASYRVLEKYQAKNKDAEVDFSGVCILMAKAVEREMFLRLFDKYREYVKQERGTIARRWPKAMRKKNDGDYFPKEDKDFTLGTITYILCCNDGFKQEDKNLFKKYAQEKLYPAYFSDYDIEDNIELINRMSQEINNKYRNNAAHKHKLDYETASSCKDYIIYVERALKEILGKMTH